MSGTADILKRLLKPGAASKSRRPCGMLLAPIVALAVSVSLVSPSVGHALNSRGTETSERIALLRAGESEILEAIRLMDEMVALELAAAEQAERRVNDAEAALSLIEGDLQQTRARLLEQQRSLAPRLVARYRLGEQGILPLLLSMRTVPEMFRTKRMLERIIEADAKAIRSVRRLNQMLEEQRAALDKAREELEDLRSGAAARLGSLREARADRRSALSEIRADRRLQESALAEIQRARAAMHDRMQRMPHQPGEDRGFADLRGRLERPVPGAITTPFGVEIGGQGGQKIHRGVDIRAPRGTPVRAVAEGRVVHADWLRGYGNLVIVDHGGGYYTLMAHLERTMVAVGEAVSVGETVGLVGDSGSFDGTHLYFEIRHGARALDPEAWFAR